MGRKVCIVIMEQQIGLSNAIFLEPVESNETYQKETCLFSYSCIGFDPITALKYSLL